MRFTEHELTAAVTGVAKQMLAARSKDVRRGRVEVQAAWEALSRYERFQLLDSIGTQILGAMVALPDVRVEPGQRPTYTDAEIIAAVEERLGEDSGGRLRRKATVAARAALLKSALQHVPPRQDPDVLEVPDSL